MIVGDDVVNISEIKNNLVSEIEKLVKIIKNEYPDLVDLPDNYDLNKLVHIENTGTISLYVSNGNFYFPLDAFKVLGTLKKIPGFGMIKNHKTCSKDNMIINDNTFMTYIKHVFLKGLTPEEYFKEILLHETLHFCGSGGGTAIREGINELKTRQLAQKYGLLTSSCGYPKETKIAFELEKIFGENIINRISFSENSAEIEEILNSVSLDAYSFFSDLERVMEREFYTKYMKHKFPGLMGPFKKTKKYNSIDYTKAYRLIEEYKRNLQTSRTIVSSDMPSERIESQMHSAFDERKSLVGEKKINVQNANYNNSEKSKLSSYQSNIINSSIHKKPFDQRSQTEVQIAEQIRVKNYAIAQQKSKQRNLEPSKKLIKTNPNVSSSNKGYVHGTILFLVFGFAAGMLTILMYFILK